METNRKKVGRKRSLVRLQSAEDEALTLLSNEAELKLKARTEEQAHARDIRSKELEKIRRLVDGNDGKADDLYEDCKNDPLSDDSYEKYRKAMVRIAQLDNEKHALAYQNDVSKDTMYDLRESLAELQLCHKEKCQDYEIIKKEKLLFESECKNLRRQLAQIDELLQDHGYLITGSDDQLTLTKSTDGSKSMLVTTLETDEIFDNISHNFSVKDAEQTLQVDEPNPWSTLVLSPGSSVTEMNNLITPQPDDRNTGYLVDHLPLAFSTSDINSTSVESKSTDISSRSFRSSSAGGDMAELKDDVISELDEIPINWNSEVHFNQNLSNHLCEDCSQESMDVDVVNRVNEYFSTPVDILSEKVLRTDYIWETKVEYSTPVDVVHDQIPRSNSEIYEDAALDSLGTEIDLGRQSPDFTYRHLPGVSSSTDQLKTILDIQSVYKFVNGIIESALSEYISSFSASDTEVLQSGSVSDSNLAVLTTEDSKSTSMLVANDDSSFSNVLRDKPSHPPQFISQNFDDASSYFSQYDAVGPPGFNGYYEDGDKYKLTNQRKSKVGGKSTSVSDDEFEDALDDVGAIQIDSFDQFRDADPTPAGIYSDDLTGPVEIKLFDTTELDPDNLEATSTENFVDVSVRNENSSASDEGSCAKRKILTYSKNFPEGLSVDLMSQASVMSMDSFYSMDGSDVSPSLSDTTILDCIRKPHQVIDSHSSLSTIVDDGHFVDESKDIEISESSIDNVKSPTHDADKTGESESISENCQTTEKIKTDTDNCSILNEILETIHIDLPLDISHDVITPVISTERNDVTFDPPSITSDRDYTIPSISAERDYMILDTPSISAERDDMTLGSITCSISTEHDGTVLGISSVSIEHDDVVSNTPSITIEQDDLILNTLFDITKRDDTAHDTPSVSTERDDVVLDTAGTNGFESLQTSSNEDGHPSSDVFVGQSENSEIGQGEHEVFDQTPYLPEPLEIKRVSTSKEDSGDLVDVAESEPIQRSESSREVVISEHQADDTDTYRRETSHSPVEDDRISQLEPLDKMTLDHNQPEIDSHAKAPEFDDEVFVEHQKSLVEYNDTEEEDNKAGSGDDEAAAENDSVEYTLDDMDLSDGGEDDEQIFYTGIGDQFSLDSGIESRESVVASTVSSPGTWAGILNSFSPLGTIVVSSVSDDHLGSPASPTQQTPRRSSLQTAYDYPNNSFSEQDEEYLKGLNVRMEKAAVESAGSRAYKKQHSEKRKKGLLKFFKK